MGLKVLSQSQVEQFEELGYVVLREAFPRQVAAAVREFLFKDIGLSEHNRTDWREPVVHLQKIFEGPPFNLVVTSRLMGAFDDLMNEGRWKKIVGLGWWPISFPGFEPGPWQKPVNGWHVDGIQFHHHVNSREQGLLPLFLFSDIEPGDGGTALAQGSHKKAARILAAAEPDGLEVTELCQQMGLPPEDTVIEATGMAGDVVLNHPFLQHARSMNTGSRVRFICNPCASLHENMNLHRVDDKDYSPVEWAIVKSLKVG